MIRSPSLDPHPRPRLLLCLAGLLHACTWVSGEAVDARRAQMDDDGDGFVLSEDCDDANAEIRPDASEVWYDGVDSDCLRDDDYDQDADGYVADELQGLPTAQVDGSGALPGGDCDDTTASTSPAASDAWYDGVDADCTGNDDYDQDADGYVADADQGKATANAPGTGALPGGDCDDLLAEVHPATKDAWYDGIDTDCDGRDDYDQDGDQQVRPEDAGKTTQYVDGTGTLPGGDCDDQNAQAYTGATDRWYDGVDSDCRGDDDYDQDLDLHGDPRQPDGLGDDCDDTDPTAWPGNHEILGDGVDHDCDGMAGRFLLEPLAEARWREPRDLRFDQNSSTVFLSLASTEATLLEVDYFDSALALTWDAADPLAAEPGALAWFMNLVDPSFVMNRGHAFLATDDEVVGAFGFTYTSSGARSLRLGGYDLDTRTRFGANSPASADAPFEDVALARSEDGMFHALGCEREDGVGRYMRATRAQLTTSYDATEPVDVLPASTCTLHFFDDPLGTMVSAQDEGLVSVPFDPSSETPFGDIFDCLTGSFGPTAPPVAGGDTGATDTGATDTGATDTGGGDTGGPDCEDPSVIDPEVEAVDVERVADLPWLLLADIGADAVVLVPPAGMELQIPVEDPMFARAVLAPDGLVYVSYVDGSGRPGLAWGNAALGFEQLTLDPGFTVTEAAVEVTGAGDVLLYAVAGGDELALGAALLD